MRRRIVLALLVLSVSLAIPVPAAQYMDCYPAKFYPNDKEPSRSRCLLDHTQDCMICTVTVTL
ncbi:MAG TPA: hypothetical protein VF266_15015 [Thermoanaerobaculia bacterium]